MDSNENTEISSLYSAPGRRFFFVRDLQALMDNKDYPEQSIILLNIEIENIGFILRTFGPDVCDKIISELANKISSVTSSVNTNYSKYLYHLNHFRFAQILIDCNLRTAFDLTKILVKELEDSVSVDDIHFNVDIKIGISQYPNHADNVSELIRTAAFASHLARKGNHDYAMYDSVKDTWEKYQFRLLTDVERALTSLNEIRLAYQPLINLKTGKCDKAEGLCRWRHPVFGDIAPDNFIPFVEQSDLIIPFTETILELGLGFIKKFKGHKFDGSLAINLSVSVFQKAEFIPKIMDIFNYYNIDVKEITFEITETALMEHPKSSILILNQLSELGFGIAIDDFGSGYSSLAYLVDLPFSVLKIDRRFISEIDQPKNEVIIEVASSLAEKLGFETVAEGIETELQYKKCIELNVTYGQGYYFAKPMFDDDFFDWVSTYGSDISKQINGN
ncbi:MAG: EAL domain-containing protein (putative c-di-GMP-specific phosphodiesterase class I) [Pseudohongiellaceae bacterium]|jgi:EAL domain-containing protein (putative c-di-GMP-specific phosphodiesterase class I)/GGDEF domain-containing protein